MIELPFHSYTLTPLPLHVKIGKYSSIADDCYFHPSNDNHYCVKNKKCVYTINWKHYDTNETIEIGNDTWIGRGVNVLPGVKIGSGAIVGAHSVVTKDVPDFAVVVGNPARIKRYRFTRPQIKKLLKMQWWEDEVSDEKKEDMEDIDKFLNKYA